MGMRMSETNEKESRMTQVADLQVCYFARENQNPMKNKVWLLCFG